MTGFEAVCIVGFFALVFLLLLPWAVGQVKLAIEVGNSLKRELEEKSP